jgi:hypothetical protein
VSRQVRIDGNPRLLELPTVLWGDAATGTQLADVCDGSPSQAQMSLCLLRTVTVMGNYFVRSLWTPRANRLLTLQNLRLEVSADRFPVLLPCLPDRVCSRWAYACSIAVCRSAAELPADLQHERPGKRARGRFHAHSAQHRAARPDLAQPPDGALCHRRGEFD